MTVRLPNWAYLVPFAIMAMGFAIGQGKEGAGVPVVILLSIVFAIYSHKRWGRGASNG